MFIIQTLIAVAVAVGVAAAWTLAFVAAASIWQRGEARAVMARGDVTIPAQADGARDLVLR